MTLLDRITPKAVEPQDRDFSITELSAAIFFFAKGDWDGAKIKQVLGLDSTDDAQLNLLATRIAGLSANEQLVFALDVFYAGVMWEQGRIDQAEFLTLLGL